MITDEPLHGMLQDLTRFKFVRMAKLLQYVPKTKCYATGKVYGILPYFAVLAQVLKKEIVETVLNDILDHVVSAVIGQKTGKAGQVPVR